MGFVLGVRWPCGALFVILLGAFWSPGRDARVDGSADDMKFWKDLFNKQLKNNKLCFIVEKWKIYNVH